MICQVEHRRARFLPFRAGFPSSDRFQASRQPSHRLRSPFWATLVEAPRRGSRYSLVESRHQVRDGFAIVRDCSRKTSSPVLSAGTPRHREALHHVPEQGNGARPIPLSVAGPGSAQPPSSPPPERPPPAPPTPASRRSYTSQVLSPTTSLRSRRACFPPTPFTNPPPIRPPHSPRLTRLLNSPPALWWLSARSRPREPNLGRERPLPVALCGWLGSWHERHRQVAPGQKELWIPQLWDGGRGRWGQKRRRPDRGGRAS